jgi:hypothetical protein
VVSDVPTRSASPKVAVVDLNLRSYEEFEAEAKDVTADSTVAEIQASGATALGIEVDVRDHEAVEAMVASGRPLRVDFSGSRVVPRTAGIGATSPPGRVLVKDRSPPNSVIQGPRLERLFMPLSGHSPAAVQTARLGATFLIWPACNTQA